MGKHKFKLTVAMATYEDFDGVFFTTQSMRLHHDMENCEILILDNRPDSEHAREVKGFAANANTKLLPVRYVPFADSTGTTQTRQRLFDLAEGEVVLVLDCHVLLQANAIHNLKNFFATADEEMRKNLFTGPLLMDTLGMIQTHFECEWRDQMWGTWATAWRDPNGILMVGRPSNRQPGASDPGTLEMKVLNTDGPWMRSDIHWYGHQDALVQKGFKMAGWGPDQEPFEIPAQGLGLFCSTKDDWLGFNPDFRSFGGEECYIHEKYRQAGRKTMCLPFLKWNHRFGRPGGPKYPITVEGKMRNYILGFNELGLSLDPVRKHFVEEVGISPMVWDYVVKDPVNYNPIRNEFRREPPNTGLSEFKPEAKSNLGFPLPLDLDSFQMVATFLQTKPRDLDKHAPKLIELASDCSSVFEVTKRRESTAFLLAGLTRINLCKQEQCQKDGCQGVCSNSKQKVRMFSYQAERDTLMDMLHEVVRNDNGKAVTWTDQPFDLNTIPEMTMDADLTFIDTKHTGERLTAELNAYAPRTAKYIVMRGTRPDATGIKGEDGKEGLLYAIKAFLKANPEWFVYYYTIDQYGLCVLSKLQDKRPAERIWPFPKACGPGSVLSKMLSETFGINPSPTCGCRAKAAEMDQKGCDWSLQNIEGIIDVMEKSAKIMAEDQYDANGVLIRKGSLLCRAFTRIGAKLVVKRAIRQARKMIEAGECD